jgi:hypothetical protein
MHEPALECSRLWETLLTRGGLPPEKARAHAEVLAKSGAGPEHALLLDHASLASVGVTSLGARLEILTAVYPPVTVARNSVVVAHGAVVGSPVQAQPWVVCLPVAEPVLPAATRPRHRHHRSVTWRWTWQPRTRLILSLVS